MPNTGQRKPLSEREGQLIELAANGFTDAAIANRLGISRPTVATYWARIRMKFGPLPRTELIAHAVREQYEDEIESLKEENRSLLRTIHQAGSTATSTKDDFFMSVLEATGDAILVVDRNGVIDWVNSQTTELFGYSKSELSGKHLSTLVPERFHNIHKKHVQDFFAKPNRRTMAGHSTTYAVNKEGEELPISATLSPVSAMGELLVVCIVRPLSAIAAKRLGIDRAAR